jgi:hypothetical protein
MGGSMIEPSFGQSVGRSGRFFIGARYTFADIRPASGVALRIAFR